MKSQSPRPRATYAPITRSVSKWWAAPMIVQAMGRVTLSPTTCPGMGRPILAGDDLR